MAWLGNDSVADITARYLEKWRAFTVGQERLDRFLCDSHSLAQELMKKYGPDGLMIALWLIENANPELAKAVRQHWREFNV